MRRRGDKPNWQHATCALALMMSACQAHPTVSPLPPRTIGSVSLCADSYLLALAPERIGALSWQAGSSLSTAPPELADLPQLRGERERLHAASGTLSHIVSSAGERTDGARVPVTTLSFVNDFEGVAENLLTLSDNIDADASDQIARIAALDSLSKPMTPPRVLYLSRSGGSAGVGTYIDSVITKAGGVNANAAPGWNTPSTEWVLASRPDLVMTSYFGSNYRGVSDRAVRHSALREFIAATPRVDIPGKLWPCAGPGLVDATRQLNAAILALESGA